MLSNRVPASIKIFLAALAIVDDLGAILVIAIFYTEQLHWIYLLISGGIILLLILFNKFGVKNMSSTLFLVLFYGTVCIIPGSMLLLQEYY